MDELRLRLFSHSCVWILLLTCYLMKRVHSVCNENDNWMRNAQLKQDSNIITIYWNYTDSNLTLMAVGKTKGWLGIGFSPSGSMVNADIAMGWVDNGTAYLEDLFAFRNGHPSRDDIQSYELLEGRENETDTLICWTRRLNTCDKEDFQIDNDTVRVIWAFNNEDPEDGDVSLAKYHSSNRGVKSLRLLGYSYSNSILKEAEFVDFTSHEVLMPNNTETLYWCTPIKVKKQKSHIIGFEPKFQKDNEELLHHFIFFECSPEVSDDTFKSFGSSGYDCHGSHTVHLSQLCQGILLPWALGVEQQVFPPDVGLQLGREDRETYYILEIHYNIHPKHYGVRDSSGVRIYYTNNLRKYDAGILSMGTDVTQFQIIPPKQRDFSITGICSKKCREKVFPPGGVNVFGIFFHSHFAGRKIRFHRYRNGKEFQPIADEFYDFNYQQPKFFKENFQLYANDTIFAECLYDTTNQTKTTVGGFPSGDEMCMTLLYYYPKMPLKWCMSSLKAENVFDITGMKKDSTTLNNMTYYFNNMLVRNHLQSYEWTNNKIYALKQLYKSGTQRSACRYTEGMEEGEVDYPEETVPFQRKENEECKSL